MLHDLATAALVLVGGVFVLLAGVGILRMPDLFMRMQAATKGATLGAGCLLLAVAVHFWDVAVGARAVLVIAFVFLTAPVAAHLIARAAYSVGVPLWGGTLRDELQRARAAGDRTPHSESPGPEASRPD
jgi:multicomponent Na+:H+ antiporter subunit G